MADASVAITAGAGTPVATRTNPQGEHQQIFVVGNPDGAEMASVKAASTAPVAADGALVVTLHPLSPGAAGGVAHDAADSGDPIKVGFRAVSSLSGETVVGSGDRVNGNADIDGAQITRPYCSLADIVDGRASTVGTSNVALISAQGSGVRTYLTSISISNTSATDVTVNIVDGTTIRYTIPAPKAGGAVVNLPVPLRGTANTAWNFASSGSVTTLTVSVVGFKSKV